MQTGIVVDPRYQAHDTGAGHPERPERLAVLQPALAERTDLARVAPRLATPEEITLVHDAALYEAVERTATRAHSAFDADTPASAASFETARLATGGLLALLDEVIAGRLRTGFAFVRPPGHHAEHDRAMGFCLFNNVAIGAAYLRARHGLERVMVVDWDVHHGNGTQHAFSRQPGVLFVSTHRWPFYPGTGAIDEIGERDGRGYTVNLPFPGGFGDIEYAEAFERIVVPLALEYEPQCILISAGFDPHRRDPLGGMTVTEHGFAAMAHALVDAARQVCDGRVVAVLEGGYDLRALRDSALAVLDQLDGAPLAPAPPHAPSHAAPILDAVRRLHRDQWHNL
ncbi:MAG: histone deacetylase [Deltaproteobacteria bacterium]|nr:histone deacetylase [Deltaproteobacteria bacterium]